jgi:hypothetical protein
MGRESTQQTTPDLFSTDEVREPSSSGSDRAKGVPSASQRHVLPENLDRAIKQLADDELMQLLDVALQEAEQRGKSPLRTGGDLLKSARRAKVAKKQPKSEDASNRKQVEVADSPLSPGKLNAVRAAFKAGVTLSRIAKQFGISQSNVRKAIAAK